MDTTFLQKVEKDFVKRDPDIRPGDTVVVHLRITEAGKERVQLFEGVIIGVKGSGLSKMITVRKISNGVGVEKILPVNSPMIKKIDVKTRGDVRRSKLYYMRDKVGKRSLDVTLDEHFEEMLEEDEIITEDTEKDEDPSSESEEDVQKAEKLKKEKEEEKVEKSDVSEETEEKDPKITEEPEDSSGEVAEDAEEQKDSSGEVAEDAEEQKKKDTQQEKEETPEKEAKAEKKEGSGEKTR